MEEQFCEFYLNYISALVCRPLSMKGPETVEPAAYSHEWKDTIMSEAVPALSISSIGDEFLYCLSSSFMLFSRNMIPSLAMP